MLKKISKILLVVTASVVVFVNQGFGYSQKDLNDELVMAAYWMQYSPEYRGLVYQGFNTAYDNLEEKVNQVPKPEKPAIIVDIDDTLVKGTPFFSSMVGTDETLTTDRSVVWWKDSDKQIIALPGAVDFISKVAKLGVEVFFSSGRYNTVMQETKETLLRLGFVNVDEEHILLQPTNAESLSKAKRLQDVKEKGFNIVMLLGDQLEDLAPEQFALQSLPRLKSYENVTVWVNENLSMFGYQWVLFPNPLYGRWERFLDENYQSLSTDDKHKVRLRLLNTSLDKENGPVFRQHMIQAALWQNFSANYHALTHQTYNQARRQLIKIKSKPSEQPTAVAINIDGTVLNIGDELSLLNLKNNIKNRDTKLLKTDNKLVSGVKAFLNDANMQGVEIFYISNRPVSSNHSNGKNDIKAATIKNLVGHGLPSADEKHILFAEEFCSDNPDKKCCRKAIENGQVNGTKYHIMLFVGDKLDDFDMAEQDLNPRKTETSDQIASNFGRRYFLIPQLLSMPDIRRDHEDMKDDKNVLRSMNDEELGQLRVRQIEGWKGKPLKSVSTEGASKR